MSHRPLTELRQQLVAHRPQRSRDGYPSHVRAAVVAAVPELQAAGWAPARIARDLGIAGTTLAQWLRKPAPSSFRPVTVVERMPTPPSTLTLVMPNGVRLEGLDVEAAAALLARLA